MVKTVLITTVAYFLAAKLGLLLAFAQTNATPVWPAAGIALAVCLLYGQRVWPGIFLGAFLANLTMLLGNFSWTAALFLSLGTAAGNTLEALIGAALINRAVEGRPPFNRTPDAVSFVLFGALASSMTGATIGSTGFCLHSSDWSRFGDMWLTWWLGDAVGAIIFAPLLLTWNKRSLTCWSGWKIGEALILLALMMSLEAVVFGKNLPLEYLIIPLLLWTAFRFSLFETVVAVLVVMVSFLAWTVAGHGPFAGDNLNKVLLFLQSFLAVTSVTTLLVSVLTTERRQAETELREHQAGLEAVVLERTAELANARDRAETADQLKSAFLATMSHELRTPLNSIIGFTGILQQGLVGPVNEEQAKQLGMVRNSANHLLALISDVLDISKIESGQLTVICEQFDIRNSIRKVALSIRPLSEKKGLELVEEIDNDVGPMISDVRRVEQILLNLLSNAVKFTEKGTVRISCRRDGEAINICVSDTGIGIKQEDMATIFKPFRQIDTGLNRKFEGSGLGLSICWKLVEMLGGRIVVESRPGMGSSFRFTLPAAGVGR